MQGSIIESAIPRGAYGVVRNALRVIPLYFLMLVGSATLAATAPEPLKATEPTEMYFMQLSVSDYLLAHDLPALVSKEALYVQFETFLTSSQLPITKQADGTWQGWFFNRQNTFVLNLENMQLELSSGSISVSADDFFEDEYEGFFVRMASLEAWCGLVADVDYRQQTVKLASEDLFPVELSSKREADQMRYRDEEQAPAYEVADQYHWWTLPRAYIRSDFSHNNADTSSSSSLSSSASMSFDLLKHHTFYAGSLGYVAGDGLSTAQRITFERRAPTEHDSLRFGVDRYAFGDIFVGSDSFVSSGGSGTGFVIERNQASQIANSGTATITGNAPPGWDAQLYLRGNILDFAEVQDDGRYSFAEQITQPGKNLFVVELYGPEGQIEKQEHLVWGGGLELEPGDYHYRLGHVTFDTALLDGDLQRGSHNGAEQYNILEFGYGLSDDVQAGLGYLHLRYNDTLKFDADGNPLLQIGTEQPTSGSYYLANVRANVFNGVLLGQLAKQQTGGSALEISYLGELATHSYSLVHQVFDNFISPLSAQNITLSSASRINWFGASDFKYLKRYSLHLVDQQLINGDTNNEFINRMSGRIGPVSLGNELTYSQSSNSGSKFEGTLRASGRLLRYNFQGSLDYAPGDDQMFRFISGKVRWRMSKGVLGTVTISKQLANSSDTVFSGDLKWRLKGMDIGINATYSANAWGLSLNFSTSVGYDRHRQDFYASSRNLSGSGRTVFDVFVDDNNNDMLDPDEEVVENVGYNGSKNNSSVSEKHVQLRDIPRFYSYEVKTALFDLPDPYLTPSYERYEIYTHPGSELRVNIPVRVTGDIEGFVYKEVAGKTVGLAGQTVELLGEEGEIVRTAQSEFDGYYNFAATPVGEYRVRISADDESQTRHEQEVLLDRNSGYITVENVVVQ